MQRSLYDTYGARIFGRYGFCDALHPDKTRIDPDVLVKFERFRPMGKERKPLG